MPDKIKCSSAKCMYLSYMKYILKHKYYVAIECIKMGLFIHAITHDMSKFRPSEFFPYARYFYGNFENSQQLLVKKDFDRAWLMHQNRNPHHWDFWVSGEGDAYEMPTKYVLQMVADWKGMSRKFGDVPMEWYQSNKDKINLHPITASKIESLLR